MKKIIIWVSAIIAVGAAAYYFAGGPKKIETVCYSASLIFFSNLLIPIRKYSKDFNLHKKTTLSSKRNEEIRVSFSYLIRIRIKDEYNQWKYLLVYNKKIKGFQPPGGVYKYHDSNYLNEIKAKDDDNFHEKNDLRISIKRKYLPDLLEKFKNKKGRETDCNREFREELIETGILKNSVFKNPKFNLLYSNTPKIKYSKFFKTDEYKYFDVYEIILDPIQESFLKSILNKKSKLCYWASEEEMSVFGYKKLKEKDTVKILEHTPLIYKRDHHV